MIFVIFCLIYVTPFQYYDLMVQPYCCKWQNSLCFISWIILAQMAKNPPAKQETWIQFLGWKDTLKKGMVNHSNVLA